MWDFVRKLSLCAIFALFACQILLFMIHAHEYIIEGIIWRLFSIVALSIMIIGHSWHLYRPIHEGFLFMISAASIVIIVCTTVNAFANGNIDVGFGTTGVSSVILTMIMMFALMKHNETREN